MIRQACRISIYNFLLYFNMIYDFKTNQFEHEFKSKLDYKLEFELIKKVLS